MNLGIFLQYLGVGIAIIGFIVAEKVNHSELQAPALVVGIIISVIGFLKHLGTPVKEQEKVGAEEYHPRYTTTVEKNRAFLTTAICHALFLFVPSYLNSEDFVEFKLFFVPLALMCILFLIREYRTIYRK